MCNIGIFLLFWGICLVLFVSADTAYAYLDPGTGSYIFQCLLAMAVGSLMAIKMFWLQIKRFVSKLFGKQNNELSSKIYEDEDQL